MTLQVRRGTLAELATITPANGEPIWTTDVDKLYMGDGVTTGGILVSAAQDVSTVSNVTFANVVVTNTATVAAIRFGDGSVQTTADTANPDQSVNTTSNVRFNSAVIATTATVTTLKFGDGSTMTTADTANPDQALNTTSNVVFTSVTVGSGAGPGNVYPWTGQNLVLGPATGGRIAVTSSGAAIGTDAKTNALEISSTAVSVNGVSLNLADAPIKVAVSNTFTVKEINSDQNIIVATTASFKTFVNNAQALEVYAASGTTNFNLSSGGNPAAISVSNDANLSIGSSANTFNVDIKTNELVIQRPSTLGGESKVAKFTATEVTLYQPVNCQSNLTVGPILYRDKYETLSITTSTANTSTFLVTQWDNSIRSTQKFMLQAIDVNSSPNKIHFQEISIVDDGTNQYKVEYGINTNAGQLGSYSVNASGTTSYLTFTPNALVTASPNAFKIMGEQLQIRNA